MILLPRVCVCMSLHNDYVMMNNNTEPYKDQQREQQKLIGMFITFRPIHQHTNIEFTELYKQESHRSKMRYRKVRDENDDEKKMEDNDKHTIDSNEDVHEPPNNEDDEDNEEDVEHDSDSDSNNNNENTDDEDDQQNQNNQHGNDDEESDKQQHDTDDDEK